jgi:hypothetical protein
MLPHTPAPRPAGRDRALRTGTRCRRSAWLILSARRIAFDHWPDDSGRCPVCRTRGGCEALTHALRYLECVRDTMLPTLVERRHLPATPAMLRVQDRAQHHHRPPRSPPHRRPHPPDRHRLANRLPRHPTQSRTQDRPPHAPPPRRPTRPHARPTPDRRRLQPPRRRRRRQPHPTRHPRPHPHPPARLDPPARMRRTPSGQPDNTLQHTA